MTKYNTLGKLSSRETAAARDQSQNISKGKQRCKADMPQFLQLGLKYQPPTLLDKGCGDAASTYEDMRRRGNAGMLRNSLNGRVCDVFQSMGWLPTHMHHSFTEEVHL